MVSADFVCAPAGALVPGCAPAGALVAGAGVFVAGAFVPVLVSCFVCVLVPVLVVSCAETVTAVTNSVKSASARMLLPSSWRADRRGRRGTTLGDERLHFERGVEPLL